MAGSHGYWGHGIGAVIDAHFLLVQKGCPLIGNAFDVPEGGLWEAGQKWGEKYGPVVYVKIFGTPYVFLNSYQSAVDLLDKRGTNYSSRPRNVMLELEGWTETLQAVMPYGPELKASRQMLYRFLQPAAVSDYLELQARSTHKILEELLITPDNYFDLVRQLAAEIILMTTYGYQVADLDDPLVKIIENAISAFSEAQQFFLVNAFPWLKYLPAWFPGTGFQKIAKDGRRHAMALFREPLKFVKEGISHGKAVPSIASKLIESNTGEDGTVSEEELIAKTMSVIYGGGAETTVSMLLTFLLAMVLYPDVQRRAQEELDRIVGKNSLPSFNDRPNLPYINAICKECLRWQPVLPLGIPHTATKDDEYNGFHIPAGATVFANIWAMSRDSNNYYDPEEFTPERWLPTDGKKPPLDSHEIVFGFGRRICPGRYFLDNSMFIIISSILSAFNITKALDENGQPITPDGEYSKLFIMRPKPFKYSIQPRSTEMVEVICQAAESAK